MPRQRILPKSLIKLGIFSSTLSCTSLLLANPILENVAAGDVQVQQTEQLTQVNQSSHAAIINWESFNIGANETTRFVQPTSNSVTLNRIRPEQGASQIFGRIEANGKIILVNQAGIFFNDGSHVNVGSLIASTADISDQDFLAGQYQFNQSSPFGGGIVNRGTIEVANQGLTALIGNNVSNEGLIQANFGNVILASGEKFTVNFGGNPLINFSIDAPTSTSSESSTVNHSGKIIAVGGTVLVSAKTARNTLDNAINLSGVVEAKGVTQNGGTIILSAGENGKVTVSGKLDAASDEFKGGIVNISGKNIQLTETADINVTGLLGGGDILIGGDVQGSGLLPHADNTFIAKGAVLSASAIAEGEGGKIIIWSDGNTDFHGHIKALGGLYGGNGGFAETSGRYLDISQASVDVSAAHGTTGTWLLDPSDLTICNSCTTSASYSASTYSNNSTNSFLLASDLISQLATANITVQTTNTGTGGNGDITVNAPLSWTSQNTLTLSAYNKIFLNADITANNGGLTLTAANISQSITSGSSSALSATGVTANIQVANFNLQQGQWFQNTNTLPTFIVSNDFRINNGVMPSTTAQFLRVSGGSGTALSPYQLIDLYGLQGVGSTATTLGYSWQLNNSIDAFGTSNWNSGAGFRPLGNGSTLFTGNFNGQGNIIDQLYIFLPNTFYVGLFGNVNAPTIQKIGVTNINITGGNATGGLIGNVTGNASITQAFSTGVVNGYSAGGYNAAGGLIGVLYSAGASVSNSYSTASLNTSAGQTTSGLVGYSIGNISTSYSSGLISSFSATPNSGLTYVGGGTVTNSYWDTETTGVSSGSDGTGLTTAQALQQASYVGFDFTNIWYSIDGATRPILRTEASTTIYNAHQLQLMTLNPTANYVLAKNIDASVITNPSEIWGTSLTQGKGFVPVGNTTTAFTGNLNGQGYIINQLYIIAPTNNTGVGLFGKTTGSTIQNLGVTNVNIEGGDIVGGLLGQGDNSTSIHNVYTSGSVTGYAQNSQIGIGGIAGIYSGSLTNVYSMASISNYGANNSYLGGLVGVLNGTLSSAFSTGNISGTGLLGGLVGQNNGTLSTSYWDTDTSGLGVGVGGGNSTGSFGGCFGGVCENGGTLDLSLQNSYSGWSFGSSPGSAQWFILNGQTRPFLQVEYNTSVSNLHQLQLMAMALNAEYKLINNIDARNTLERSDSWGSNLITGKGFVPIGNTLNDFTGNLNGQGHFIDQLYIKDSSNHHGIGLLGAANGSLIQNLFLTNAKITGGNITGGILGQGSNVTLTNSYTSGLMTGTKSTGSVYGVGGIAGIFSGSLTNSYNLAAVVANGSNNIGGGLLGVLQSGTVTNTYSSGSVTNGAGFIGVNTAGTISNSFWDTATSGQSIGVTSGSTGNLVGGCFGSTSCTNGGTVNLALQATYSGWSFGSSPYSSTWFILNAQTRPLLQKEFSVTIGNAHQLQLMSTSLNASYQLTNNIDASSTSNLAEVWGNTGFAPVGNMANSFLGAFNGNDYVIDSLYINIIRDINGSIGLFGLTGPGGAYTYGAVIKNIGLTNANVNVSALTSIYQMGLLIGTLSQYAAVTNSYATGTFNFSGTPGTAYIGGLVGASAGLISDNYANVTINATTSPYAVGGLVGMNILWGLVTKNYSVGNLNVNLNGGNSGGSNIGGFMGLQISGNPVVDNYSLMNINVNATNANIGGFVGKNTPISFYPSPITNNYAAGTFTAISGNTTGGFIGYNANDGILTNNYWDTANGIGGSGYGINLGTTPVNLVGGCFGPTACTNGGTIDLAQQSSYSGFSFGTTVGSGTWYIQNGQTRPLLQTEYSTIVTNAHQLQLMQMDTSAHYTLLNDINANNILNVTDVWGTSASSGSGFSPITNFAGQFNGKNYTIDGLYINRSTSSNIGLFAQITAAGGVKNLVLTNLDIRGLNYVGGLAGSNQGHIAEVLTIGSIQGFGSYIGGLIGSNSAGDINYSASNATVTGVNVSALGGLVGINQVSGSIRNSYSAGTISVSGSSSQSIGGLVGSNTTSATITNSYSKNNMTVAHATNVGGFVGLNNSSITNSFSASPLSATASTQVGGFAGNNTQTISNVFWDTDVSGQTNGVGLGNLTNSSGGCFNGVCVSNVTTNLSQQSTYTNWNMTDVWGINNGASYPYLKNFSQWAIGGTSSVTNTPIYLITNGLVLKTSTTTSNGNFNFVLNKNSMQNNAMFLVSLSGPTTGNVSSGNFNNGNSINDLSIIAGTLLVGQNFIPTKTLANSALKSAIGSLGSYGILYATNNYEDISLTPTINFRTSAATSYLLSGELSVTQANLTLAGGMTLLSNSSLVSLTSGTITVDGIVDGGNYSLSITSGNNIAINGSIRNLSGLTKDGIGQLTLAGNNTYTGNTSINAGIVQIDHAYSLAESSVVTVADGATLKVNNVNAILNGSLMLNGEGYGGMGALTASGTVQFNGNIQLASDSTISNASSSDSLTLNGLINGGYQLTLSGPGHILIGGNIGGVSPLQNLQASISNLTIASTTIETLADQVYDSEVLMSENTLFNSLGGDITFNNTLNGAYTLTFAADQLVFNNSVGSITPLAAITSSADVYFYNVGTLSTVGNQTYSTPIHALIDTTLITDSGNINIAGGIVGGENIQLVGNQNNSFNLAGTFDVTGIAVSSAGGSGSLSLDTSDNQTWHITQTNNGNINNINGINGTFSFSGIGDVRGGSGTNSFILANHATLSGTLDGGSLDNINSIDASSYTTQINLALTGKSNNVWNIGEIATPNTHVVNFVNVMQATGNGGILTAPSQNATIVLTGYKIGYVGDPFYFYDFNPIQITTTSSTTVSSIMNYTSQLENNSLTTDSAPITNIYTNIDEIITSQAGIDTTIQNNQRFGCFYSYLPHGF